MFVKTVNLAPMITKSVDTEDIVTKVLGEDVDVMNDIIEPPIDNSGLKVLRYSSIWHMKALKAKAEDTAQNGWIGKNTGESENETNKNLLEKIFSDYDTREAIVNFTRDYLTYTHSVLEVLENKKGEVRGFKHIRANTIRMCKGGESAVQKVGNQTIYFRIIGKNKDEDLNCETGQWYPKGSLSQQHKATDIIWMNGSGADSDHYHEPEYIASIPTILSDEYLREYNNNGFVTNGVPNYLITIHGDFNKEADPKTNKTFDESMEDAFKELKNNPGTAVVFTIETTGSEAGMEVQVTKISEEMKEASYEAMRETNMYEILSAHEVPPQRLGINPSGPLAGSISVEINRQYRDKVITPLQNKLENIFNKKVVKDKMEIEDAVIEAKRLDVRDINSELDTSIKLVDKASMTPAQLIKKFTDFIGLDMDVEEVIRDHPELDEYYMNGQPISAEIAPTEEVKGILKQFEAKGLEILNQDFYVGK